jgi:hypothetical protein
MMKTDNFEIWKPADDINEDIYFYELQQDGEALTVSLKKLDLEGMTLVVKFNDVLSYMITNESGRLKTIHEVPSFRGFRYSMESAFLRWFKQESGGIYEALPLKHYLIYNIDNVIDVISCSDASAKWISS